MRQVSGVAVDGSPLDLHVLDRRFWPQLCRKCFDADVHSPLFTRDERVACLRDCLTFANMKFIHTRPQTERLSLTREPVPSRAAIHIVDAALSQSSPEVEEEAPGANTAKIACFMKGGRHHRRPPPPPPPLGGKSSRLSYSSFGACQRQQQYHHRRRRPPTSRPFLRPRQAAGRRNSPLM